MYQTTIPQALFCFVYWIIAYAFYSRGLLHGLTQYKNKSTPSALFVFWLTITVYSVFEFSGGDYFHYMEFYEETHIKGYNDGLDPVYLWLMDILPHNFYLWRFIVWGCATFLWVLIIRTLNQNLKLAASLLLLIIIFLFAGARQTLGFSMLYLGISLVLKPAGGIKEKIFGCLFFCSSYFFHSTLVVYMLLILVACIPFYNKNLILFSILAFPVIYKLMDSSLFSSIINNLPMLQEDSADKMTRYIESDFRAYANIFGVIRNIIARLPIWLLLIYSIKKIFWDKEQTAYLNKVFLRMTYILIYISYLFTGKEVSSFIAPRFWDASLFPFTLFLTSYLNGKRLNIFLKICLVLLIINIIYSYLYGIYKVM